MGNAARVDELWDPSTTVDGFEPFLETNRAMQAVLTTYHAPARVAEVAEFDFLGEKIAWTRDGGRAFPEQVAKILDQISQFSELPVGWDSYNGTPTASSAVRPALELIFATHRRCLHPRAVPLSGGGIGLRWMSESYEFEVDIWSPDEIEALLIDRETEQEIELESGTAADLEPLLIQFLSRP